MTTTTTTGLRDRARGGSTVARRNPAELKQQITQMESQFRLAMPKGVEAQQLVRDAMTVLSTNPNLGQCDSRSVLGALMTCAQLGLRPGVLGQAWLLPMKVKGVLKAQLIVGYQGLLALAQRSGDIASISARIVYEHDHFDYEFGLAERLVHKPAMGERGPAVAYYCVVKSKAGGTYWDVITRSDAERHRDRFAMAKRDGKVIGPWVDHFDAMALKTVVIRVLKLAPRNTEVQTAIVADESVRIDLTPTADVSTVVSTPDGSDEVDGEIDDEPTVPAVEDPPADVTGLQEAPDGYDPADPTTHPDWKAVPR